MEADDRFDYGKLDQDFLQFDELDKTIDDYFDEESDSYTRLDYDALGGDFLRDLLDVVKNSNAPWEIFQISKVWV